jgi:putative photosynthetic complex assembly protein
MTGETFMIEHTIDPGIPKPIIAAAGTLILLALVAVVIVRLTGVGAVHENDAAAVSVREFLFEDRSDGSIVILDARNRQLVDTVAPASNGFLRGTMRGLARERKRQGIGPEVAFQLVGRADGRLTLVDPGTHRRVDLESFGPTNAEVFAKLMAPQPAGP